MDIAEIIINSATDSQMIHRVVQDILPVSLM